MLFVLSVLIVLSSFGISVGFADVMQLQKLNNQRMCCGIQHIKLGWILLSLKRNKDVNFFVCLMVASL